MGGSGSKEPKEDKAPKGKPESKGKRSGSVLENDATKDLRQNSDSSLPAPTIEEKKDQKSKKVCALMYMVSCESILGLEAG